MRESIDCLLTGMLRNESNGQTECQPYLQHKIVPVCLFDKIEYTVASHIETLYNDCKLGNSTHNCDISLVEV